jgi:hypothetical protein
LSASIATSITYSARSKRRSCSARCVTAAIVLEMALVACKSSSARGILVGYHSDHCSHSTDPASMSFVGDFPRFAANMGIQGLTKCARAEALSHSPHARHRRTHFLPKIRYSSLAGSPDPRAGSFPTMRRAPSRRAPSTSTSIARLPSTRR